MAVVFYRDNEPRVFHAHVGKGQPFAIEATDRFAEQLQPEDKAVLLLYEAGIVHKAEARIKQVRHLNPGYRLELDQVFWQESDRRRYARHNISIPVTLRMVAESHDGTALIRELRGETEDISLGGAWVKTKDFVESGALVEFRAVLSESACIRALGVVVHTSDLRGGVGIEFLDYVGGARYHLHTFLSEAAA